MRKIQRIRGLATTPKTVDENALYTGHRGELVSIFDADGRIASPYLMVHDGVTAGGWAYDDLQVPGGETEGTADTGSQSGQSTQPATAQGIPAGWLNENVIDYSAFFSGNDYLQSKSSIYATTFTVSMWVKGNGNVYDYLFKSGTDVGINWVQTDGRFYMHANNNDSAYSTPVRFMDFSSWYHVVVQSNGGTAKYIINNSYESSTIPSFNLSGTLNIGSYNPASAGNFSGHMANIVLIDGEVLEPNYFAEIFEGNWIHKKLPDDQSYGQNGFYLNFADESDLGKDVSGNGNDFTVGTV